MVKECPAARELGCDRVMGSREPHAGGGGPLSEEGQLPGRPPGHAASPASAGGSIMILYQHLHVY